MLTNFAELRTICALSLLTMAGCGGYQTTEPRPDTTPDGGPADASPDAPIVNRSFLVGTWRQVLTIGCDEPGEETPEVPVGELVFRSDGSFAVTWHPFESYQDYWGTYRFDEETGQLSLGVDDGNYVPLLSHLRGTATLNDAGLLVLDEFWFGASPEATDPTELITPTCGCVFEEL